MNPQIDSALHHALCELVGALLGTSVDSLDELDNFLGLRTLAIQIDEVALEDQLSLKDINWETVFKELGVYLEGLDIYDCLSVDPDVDLKKPPLSVIVNLMCQLIAVHWLASPKIEEVLPRLDKADQEVLLANVGPFKSTLAEVIARELISGRKDAQAFSKGLQRSNTIRKDSVGSSASSKNQAMLTNMNNLERQLKKELEKTQKLENIINGLNAEIGDACAKNDELDQKVKDLTAENQRLKTEQRYQNNRLTDMEILLDKEKTEKEHYIDEVAKMSEKQEKLKQTINGFQDKEDDYNRLLLLEDKFNQYMGERNDFLSAESEIKKKYRDLYERNEEGLKRMTDMAQLFNDQQTALQEETRAKMQLQQENMILTNENQQLRVEVSSFNKLFTNDSLKKRKQDESKSPSRAPAKNEDVELLKNQLTKYRAEVAELRRRLEEQEHEFQSEMAESIEVHKKQAQMLMEARAEAETATKALHEAKVQSEPLELTPLKSKAAERVAVETSDRETQVDAALLEKKEIDSNHIIYAAVMEFMQGHMENFKDSYLKTTRPRGELPNFFSGGKLRS